MNFKIPRGTKDIIPGEIEQWHYVEAIAREICENFQYKEIRTPIFEETDLFTRSVGDTTDIVQKEMYSFQDRGKRSLTLRPEGTASTVRSYISHKMHGNPSQPVKLYYMGPMFRYERPQSGRYRQFVQFGVEAIGSADPAIDAEVISLAMELYSKLGLKNLRLVINSLGDKTSRQAHREALINHFQPQIQEFCKDCQDRISTNPLRILDCKVDDDHELMEKAPSILDYLTAEASQYFEKVKKYLDSLDIKYIVDPNLVRGLDYYNHTAFEIMSDAEGFGAITTLCGGGRYNGLVEELGGPKDIPGIGFALSIERLLAALEAEKVQLPIEDKLDCYIVSLGEAAEDKSVQLVYLLRQQGIAAERDYLGRKLRGQFRAADRSGAEFVAVLGENELAENVINVRNLETGVEESVYLANFVDYIKEQKWRKNK